MFRHLSQFAVKLADLAEAEGRELRRMTGRVTLAFAAGLAGAGLFLGGAFMLLFALWVGLLALDLGRGAAAAIIGLLAIGLAAGAFYLVVRLVK